MMKGIVLLVLFFEKINSPPMYHGKDLKSWKGLGRNLLFISKGISYSICWIMSILRENLYLKSPKIQRKSFRYFHPGRI